MLGPKGIPEPVLAALNKEFVAALDDKEVRERLTGFGLEVTEGRDNTVANLKKHIDDFAATYGKLIAEHGHQGRVGIETAGQSRPLAVTCLALAYSTLAPENSTTFFHFAVSDTMILPKSSGVPPIGAPPRSAIRAFIFGSASASSMCLLR